MITASTLLQHFIGIPSTLPRFILDEVPKLFRVCVEAVIISIRIRYLSIIYLWGGQRIFETSDAGKGWDGEKAMPGVYVWVITYENRIGKADEMRGELMLLK